MKTVLKLSLFISIFVILSVSLLFVIMNGVFNKPLQRLAEYYLSNDMFKIYIDNLQIKNHEIFINNIKINAKDGNSCDINKLRVEFTFSGLIINPIINATLYVDDFTLINDSKENIIKGALSGTYNAHLFHRNQQAQINVTTIPSAAFGIKNQSNSLSTCSYSKKTSNHAINCNLKFNSNSSILIDTKIKNKTIESHIFANAVPIMTYKIFEKFIPNHEIILFMHQYIKAGHITSGELHLKLDNNMLAKGAISKENLNGKFNITGLEYCYSKNFPTLKKVDIEVLLSGPSTKILFYKGYSGDTLISNGTINLNWAGTDSSKVIISAISRGPTSDLSSFISLEGLNNAKKIGLDLAKLKNIAKSKIDIIAPLNPLIANSYNISTKIMNVNLAILSGAIKLTNITLNGLFDGKRCIFDGKGKINNLDSELIYKFNIMDDSDYLHLLNVKTILTPQNHDIDFATILSGSAIMNIEYKNKNNNNYISVDSDLQNLEFYINKVAIHKLVGEKANINMNGKFNLDFNGTLNFKLIGENNLKIIGSLLKRDKEMKLALSDITHKDDNIHAKISIDPNLLDIVIGGDILDLSLTTMQEFITKGDKKSINLILDVNRIKLQNNIWLHDIHGKVKCDKTKCTEGFLDTKIGTKSFVVKLLSSSNDKEKWLIRSENAGATLKAFNMYKAMKSGSLELILDMNDKDMIGNFTINKFILSDTDFLTQMVSFVSIPGFMNMITNNRDISFQRMIGSFHYSNNLLKINESVADGPYFDFTMAGTVDMSNRKIDIHGQITPSAYGLNSLIKIIPLLGSILSKKNGTTALSKSYKIKKNY